MLKKYILLFSFTVFTYSISFAQLGGDRAYTFLEQPLSARISALGGNQAAINDGDMNVAFVNPSMINTSLDNNLAINYTNYFASTNFGSIQYANTFKKAGSFMASIQFMDYGTFDYADEGGNLGGTFGASDFAFNIGWGRQRR